MSKVNWATAPEGAQYYANKAWWKADTLKAGWLVLVDDVWLCADLTVAFAHSPFFYDDVDSKADHIVDANKKVWPASESRMDAIGQNGNDGLVYQQEDKMRRDEFREGQTPKITISGKATGSPGGSGSNFAHDGELVTNSKYNRDVIGLDGTKTTIDVYRVLDAFKTESAALDHAVKKILCPGNRHSKDRKQDLQEAINSIAAELLIMSQR